MKIASVCRVLPTPDNPAAGAFVLRRLAAMAGKTRLRVIQPVPHLPLVRPLPAWAREPAHIAGGVTIEHAPMTYLPGLLKSLDGRWLEASVYPRLAALQAAGELDLVDAHFGYPDGVGCVRAARRLGIPAFITLRGMEVDAIRHPRIGPQLAEALRQAAGCITVSHALRDLALEAGVQPDHVLVAPNAVDRASFHPGDRAAARVRLGLEPDAPLIVSVGYLIAGKGHGVLIRALARLRETLPDARLAIIGGPGYEPDHPRVLTEIAREAGVQGAVRFVGAVKPDAVALWLQAADVFALATEREGCCNSVLEALAVGLPVVTTPAGDNPRFVHNGVNGQLVGIGDVAGTAAALASVLDRAWDPEAISRALAVGNWSDVAEQVLGFMAARRRRSAAPGKP
ncbi:MAG TPA: glycosyltransferase [Steroidobacteraceae bacterium]|nr:glycosyltransferase [Steroidobacteraceae bacterium]HNS28805.1 glycosyltransferase [Steroidobacteraceae bacterium]